ncbi:Putative F-box protein At4g38870 [Linum perenne]
MVEEPGFNESDKKMKQADEKGCLIVDDDLVVIQILSRLPVKSLMRFKSVCKSWKSIIEQDLNFMNLHYTHSEARSGLFILRSKPIFSNSNDNKKSRELSLLSVDLQCDDKGVVNSANLQSSKKIVQSCLISTRLRFLGPVRGLICFVDGTAVQICNVSTGELATPWITSTVLKSGVGRMHRYFNPMCYFGFDPATGNHKVMFMWSRCKDAVLPPVWEVLTVGDYDARFRIIDSFPPPPSSCELRFVDDVGVCGSGGSIYWLAAQGHAPWHCFPLGMEKDEYFEYLLAFDIGSEQFRIIPIPRFTLTEDKDYDLDRFDWSELIEMDGCPTVARHYLKPDMVRMWRFHDGTTSDWTQVTIILPSHINIDMDRFHSIPGKDLMILEPYDRLPHPPQDEDEPIDYVDYLRNVMVLYSYSLKNKTFSEFKVEGISSLDDACSTACRPLVESLLPIS